MRYFAKAILGLCALYLTLLSSTLAESHDQRDIDRLCEAHIDGLSLYPSLSAGAHQSFSRNLRELFELKADPIIITDLDELKHLPFARPGMAVVAWVDHLSGISPNRAQVAAAVARHRSIQIFIVWTGPPISPSSSTHATLAKLALGTQGGFLELPDLARHICLS